MPLPVQAINQLLHDDTSEKTPGWFWGIILFPGGLLAIMLGLYFGMAFVYEPYLTKQVGDVEQQILKASQAVPSSDESGLITYYSQLANLRALLTKHVVFSQFFTWLERNTESNVYFSQFAYSGNNEASLTGNARTSNDMEQQIAIFESSSQVKKVAISNVGFLPSTGFWRFTATLVMNPAVSASPFMVGASGSTSTQP